MYDLFKSVSMIFVIIASINLGLMGLLGLDIVGSVLGSIPFVLKIFHIVVGVSGIMMLLALIKK